MRPKGFDFLRDRLLLRRIGEGQTDFLGGMLGLVSDAGEKPVQRNPFFVLVDEAGQKIDVTSHLLRHAAATVKRHEHKMPLAALAEAMGHTLTGDGEAPAATRYYSEMPAADRAVLRHESVLAMMDDARLALRVIDPEEEARRVERLLAA